MTGGGLPGFYYAEATCFMRRRPGNGAGGGSVKLIAHRGGRGFGTDNTLEAMEKAVRSGVRIIETDVRSTADGQLVICHDSSIWGHVVRRTTYDEFKRIAPDRPLLSEVLERLAGWVGFNIEIKEAPARDVGLMLNLYGIADDTVVTSFDRDIMSDYRRDFPQALTGYLYRMPYGKEKKLQHALEMGARIIAPHFSSIEASLVDEAHELGLEVYAWTVNDRSDFHRLHDWGVDAIITDHYLEMEQLLKEMSASAHPL